MKQFEFLDFEERNDIINKRGYHLLTIREQTYCITLYSVDGLLVERYFNIELMDWESVLVVRYPDLDKYLAYIRVEGGEVEGRSR